MPDCVADARNLITSPLTSVLRNAAGGLPRRVVTKSACAIQKSRPDDNLCHSSRSMSEHVGRPRAPAAIDGNATPNRSLCRPRDASRAGHDGPPHPPHIVGFLRPRPSVDPPAPAGDAYAEPGGQREASGTLRPTQRAPAPGRIENPRRRPRIREAGRESAPRYALPHTRRSRTSSSTSLRPCHVESCGSRRTETRAPRWETAR